ncbi:MAG: FAD-binding oxidoreductase [Coleofasciculus sp. S288]|nr:FAD-binding oxidoreductase [Coleofasciculus sp. S288]
MTTLFHSAVYDRTLPVGSYWETTVDSGDDEDEPLNGDRTCEVAIIGGGITGLSTALHLARDHGIEAHILEAGVPGWGASGRNGGFCCFGAIGLSHDELLKRFGLAETHRYFQEQRDAVELVRELAASEGIEIDSQGDGEIQVAHYPSRWLQLEEEYEFLTEVAQYPCTLWSKKELAEYAFHSPEAHGALHIRLGFSLNPVKYSLGLAKAAKRRGVKIYAHTLVERWEKDGSWHRLHTPQGTLKARQVIVATNGYTEDKLHSAFSDRFLPALSSIITTRPLTQAELDAQGWCTETQIWDTRNLLFYYRLLKDGRFLFGSRGGINGSPTESVSQHRFMSRRLGEMFPAWRDVEITHFWQGLVCFSATFTPHIGKLADDPTVFYALAYHGNGIATGTWSGRVVARLLVGKEDASDLCAVVNQPLKRFPLAALRSWYLRFAYVAYNLIDAIP